MIRQSGERNRTSPSSEAWSLLSGRPLCTRHEQISYSPHDHDIDTGGASYHFNISGQRLLTENMQVMVNGLHCFFCVNRCCSANGHCLEAGVLEHLVVVVVQGNPVWFQVLLPPGDLALVRGEGSHQVSSRGAVQEIGGMKFSDTA